MAEGTANNRSLPNSTPNESLPTRKHVPDRAVLKKSFSMPDEDVKGALADFIPAHFRAISWNVTTEGFAMTCLHYIHWLNLRCQGHDCTMSMRLRPVISTDVIRDLIDSGCRSFFLRQQLSQARIAEPSDKFSLMLWVAVRDFVDFLLEDTFDDHEPKTCDCDHYNNSPNTPPILESYCNHPRPLGGGRQDVPRRHSVRSDTKPSHSLLRVKQESDHDADRPRKIPRIDLPEGRKSSVEKGDFAKKENEAQNLHRTLIKQESISSGLPRLFQSNQDLQNPPGEVATKPQRIQELEQQIQKLVARAEALHQENTKQRQQITTHQEEKRKLQEDYNQETAQFFWMLEEQRQESETAKSDLVAENTGLRGCLEHFRWNTDKINSALWMIRRGQDPRIAAAEVDNRA